MTLTSLLPTLRHSIPAPFTRDLWPAGATPGLDDVVIEGVSVLRYAELCGTPCVMTAAAVIPFSGGMPSRSDTITVLTTRIVKVAQPIETAGGWVRPGVRAVVPLLVVDAVVDAAEPLWPEARLLGRVSSAADRRFAVQDATGAVVPGLEIALPGDTSEADLIALPARSGLALGDVRARVSRSEGRDVRTEGPRCGRIR